MSTNYYIHKENRLPREDLIHIGKVVFKKPVGEFLWAIKPDEFKHISKESPLLQVISESGEISTFNSFMVYVSKRNWNCEHIGTEFC